MKYLFKFILAVFVIAMFVTALPAAAEETNTVKISPATNSLLLVSRDIDFVIHGKITLQIRRVSVLFDGYDITPLLSPYAWPETTRNFDTSLLRVSIPAFAIFPGTHTLYVGITTVSGQVISDMVVYTAIETIPAPGPPPFGWPCILPGTPCE